MSFVCVLPFAYRPWAEECIKTMHPEFLKNTLLIDDTNPDTRIGIMASHNKGIERMREVGADWLIILSAAIRFGPPGGLDFVDILERHKDDHYIIHGASLNVLGGLQHKEEGKNQANLIQGWHLSGIRSSVFDNIGIYDNNFAFYSLDDIDISLRVQKFYKGAPGWNTYPCSATDMGRAHSITLGGVKGTYPPRNSYFKRKWNRDGSEWDKPAWDHPFNDPTKPLSYWPEPDDPLSIWQNEYKNGIWHFDDYNLNGRTISGTPNSTPK